MILEPDDVRRPVKVLADGEELDPRQIRAIDLERGVVFELIRDATGRIILVEDGTKPREFLHDQVDGRYIGRHRHPDQIATRARCFEAIEVTDAAGTHHTFQR